MTEKDPVSPTFTGIHHLKFPVSDLSASADWYRLAFGAERVAEDAYDYVFGYVMTNDVSARDVMDFEPLNITLCKCPDTFAPIGPHITTFDEVGDVNGKALEMTTHVNGVLKQQATTDTMIYSIPTLIEFLTQTVTMEPGDIMSSGTGGGTGVGRKPPEFMHPGDSVTVRIDRIGALTNPLMAGWKETS